MQRARALAITALALAASCVGAQPSAAAPQLTEVLQYASKPDAPGAERQGRRLVSELRKLGLAPRGFEVLPMVLVRGTPAQLRRAHRLPGVLYHHRAGRKLEWQLDETVPLVFRGPPAPVRAANGGGMGVRVAVLDTGIDGLHPNLLNRVVQNVKFAFDTETFNGTGRPNDLGLPRVVAAVPCTGPCDTDQYGHGTKVAGIVAGEGFDGKFEGMTPATDLVGLAISDTGNGYDFYVLAGLDYLLAHPELNVRAVNNSWKLPTDRWELTDPVNQATKMVHDAGITMVFAAGNDGEGVPPPGGPPGSSNCIDGDTETCAISMHGSAPWTINVAAGVRVFGGTPEDQALAPFSSRGDPRPQTIDGVEVSYVPTLTAPGMGIVSTGTNTPPSTESCFGERCSVAESLLYQPTLGTSMAAPHVTGAIPLLQTAAQEKLGRLLTPDEVKQVLVAGAAGPLFKRTGEVDVCSLDQQIPGFWLRICKKFPCPEVRPPAECATGEQYANWEVGAGYLDVPGALAAVEALAR